MPIKMVDMRREKHFAHNRIKLLATGLLGLSNGLAVAGPIDPEADWSAVGYAVQLHQAGDHTRAYQKFDELARVGDHVAQRNLGLMLAKGEGVPQNMSAAYAWFSVAVGQGDTASEKFVALAESKLSPEALVAAKQQTENLATQYAWAHVAERLAPNFSCLDSPSGEPEKFLSAKRKAPEYPSQATIRLITRSKPTPEFVMVPLRAVIPQHGHPRDYNMIAEPNSPFAKSVADVLPSWHFELRPETGPMWMHQTFLFRLDTPGNALEQDAAKLHAEWRNRAEQGAVNDIYVYAELDKYLPGLERRMSDTERLRWHYQAASGGHAESARMLAENRSTHDQCNPGASKSETWLLLAAHWGSAFARVLMADTAIKAGLKDDAVFWTNSAAATDNPGARFRRSWMLATSSNPAVRDPEQALDILDAIARRYHDEPARLEAIAAAHAANGDFSTAQKVQRKAIKQLTGVDLPLTGAEERRQRYANKQALSGEDIDVLW